MTTFTALTTLPGAGPAAALAEALEALADPAPIGVGVFEIEDGSGAREVGAFFTERPDPVALDLLAAVHGARPFAVSRLDDRDWVAQVRRELTPVPAGRFVVHGGHDRGAVPINRVGLEIEAAMAFGTGHHGTTRGCLLSLERLARQGLVAGRTADIGCGTGVLAMAARRLWRRQVIASDIDPVAVATARANLAANRAGGAVPVVCAPGFRHPALHARAPYDLVFANILAGPLCRLAPQMAAHTAPGSAIILSGILARQARRVETHYAGHRMAVRHRQQLGEWVTLTLARW
ncbi:methyltransferase [Rhodobacteraceae bacterium 2CG4]|uniref:Ribosomal protein L11 methyltransferase n=1 Tax=Halovulum marinum TaxID=2662447 RepID=A0A6L5YW33_9RHOB|nr:50S ribosomal protein L11 methyltransferase [Halovulum marinum]MSU88427.1 methyltransferase [Halovulum marinum]